MHVFSPEEEALLAEYAQAKAAISDAPAAVPAERELNEKVDEELPRKEVRWLPQSKSVRVALERLDRMMNAVGELVINRTRMVGRLKELETSGGRAQSVTSRMQEKVSEFQEKHEFSRIHMTGLAVCG